MSGSLCLHFLATRESFLPLQHLAALWPQRLASLHVELHPTPRDVCRELPLLHIISLGDKCFLSSWQSCKEHSLIHHGLLSLFALIIRRPAAWRAKSSQLDRLTVGPDVPATAVWSATDELWHPARRSAQPWRCWGVHRHIRTHSAEVGSWWTLPACKWN